MSRVLRKSQSDAAWLEMAIDALSRGTDEELHDSIIAQVEDAFAHCSDHVSALSALAEAVNSFQDDDIPSLVVRTISHLDVSDGLAQHHRIGLFIKLLISQSFFTKN